MTEVDLQALLRGDENAFKELVRAYNPTLLRLALVYSPTREVAEETVQETWIAVLRGLAGFEGRSALRTWICRILINIAHRRSATETRSLPFSSLGDSDDGGPSVSPERFLQSGPYAGHWAIPPFDLSDVPEHRLLSRELKEVVAQEISRLSSTQRAVITMRDVEGWSTDEVCETLGIEHGNVRVALHRARSRVRAALERYLSPEVSGVK
ncbi:RNA polymerase sigma-70 factor (ECF subfamily) [Thermocatellispora tengchongensis]|uniref:RNA polymerase sigma-70 factor (ECF subfamily) n=1 Tax=Thermocatellispora tengchongensis TaxID=1073253 RepID=A0A840NXN3_9ACTN|nr:sigma-70 family RNA polymerase sigma factor [Thermocatellispora tengchongensis]MBB5132268.1 RNA polymerase sigma-70 factor (ECF subfamily) [Thermocatellispora tengchongensis]